MPEQDNRIRVHISSQFEIDGVAIAIVMRRYEDLHSIMRVDERGYAQWDNIDPTVQQAPTIRMTDDVGRALLEALLRHYAGSQDLHTVRADLLHERRRVDRLITAVIDLAGKSDDAVMGT